jgi:hypothetical protein
LLRIDELRTERHTIWRESFRTTTTERDGPQAAFSQAQPNLTTAPDLLPNDSATLFGLVDPSGGTITFKLYDNATCMGSPTYEEPAQTVNGNGGFVTSNTTVTVTTDATISWIVDYSGDAKNDAMSSACSEEQAPTHRARVIVGSGRTGWFYTPAGKSVGGAGGGVSVGGVSVGGVSVGGVSVGGVSVGGVSVGGVSVGGVSVGGVGSPKQNETWLSP